MSQNKMQTDGDTSVPPNQKKNTKRLNNTIYLKNSFCFRLRLRNSMFLIISFSVEPFM